MEAVTHVQVRGWWLWSCGDGDGQRQMHVRGVGKWNPACGGSWGLRVRSKRAKGHQGSGVSDWITASATLYDRDTGR